MTAKLHKMTNDFEQLKKKTWNQKQQQITLNCKRKHNLKLKNNTMIMLLRSTEISDNYD
jgi:hypothetical protein